MKFSITPVALAVTMALGAAAAQAQTMPSYATTAPSLSGLYLAVWDTNTNTTELVNLSSSYSDLAFSGGTSALDTPTSAYTEVANPTGASGEVEQLNLGTISGFSSLFPSSQTSATDYVIVSANSGTLAGVLTSEAVGASIPLTKTAVPVMAQAMTGEVSEWVGVSNTSPISDTSGTAAYSVANPANGSLGAGDEGLAGDQFGATLGTAANFYNMIGASRTNFSQTEYGNSQGAGFWFLSATGDLTWNLLAAQTSTVPLPPAVWLFASGLIGLGLIGRRRERDLGATA